MLIPLRGIRIKINLQNWNLLLNIVRLLFDHRNDFVHWLVYRYGYVFNYRYDHRLGHSHWNWNWIGFGYSYRLGHVHNVRLGYLK